MLLAKLIDAKSITLHNAVVTLPMPVSAGTDGASTDPWFYDAAKTFTYDDAEIEIIADGATVLAGPVGVYGGRNGKEYLLGVLNNGADIQIGGANTGAAYRVRDVGCYAFLAIGGVNGANIVPTGGKAVTVKATPINWQELL